MIRVEVEAEDAEVRAGLEAVLAASPGLTLAADSPDVLVAASPLEDIHPGPPLVLLGAGEWNPRALSLGVRAMLPADATPGELVSAVFAAANGLATVDPRELESWLAGAGTPPAADTGPLSPRELEVLRLMAEGAANKNIAWSLGISEHTAKFHVASILAKLNAGTRAEAVALGIRRGLILV
ncbi:MAG: response regulator transcription factor [Acidobacteria bacterium]|nr:response regulator transcription factor [Acidobacteriota bacterium]